MHNGTSHCPMRPAVLLLLLIGTLISSGCAGDLQSQTPPQKWTTGFWLWGDYWHGLVPSEHTPDVLFVEVATFHETPGQQWGPVYADIPNKLPPASEYWLVYRYSEQSVPGEAMASEMARSYAEVLIAAHRRNLKIAGIQLDVDSPTKQLPRYAAFLRALRRELPTKTQISITCLLDWFRDGTSIADVIRETDEFVPQFYDIGPARSGNSAIAARFDPNRWSPIFNRFGKRFRIGISTFGRAQFLEAKLPGAGGNYMAMFYRDLTPLDLSANSAMIADTSQNDAGETVLTFRASRKVTIGYTEIPPTARIQFILPTPQGVRKAIAGAHRMGRYCAGVVFFRWPAADEVLVMPPDEVLGSPATPALDLVDGACAAVSCMDIYLVNGGTLNPAPLQYRITSSDDLDYFLPDRKLPLRMSGQKELDFSVPRWGGRGRLYVGRAVSSGKVTFSLEKIQ
jgi:hypothetical protein